jgi:hypothetical protein
MLVAALFAVAGPTAAEENQPKVEKKPAVADVRALLEKGQAAGSMPDGLVVRLGACLGELDEKASGENLPSQVHEMWEFTCKEVHRVEAHYKDGSCAYNRVESRPFDSKGICKDLLEGKAIEIEARKGTGPKVELAGTPYRRGSRSLEVVWHGETILNLHETNGPFLDVYLETDARLFGALYERLATQARELFKPKAD